MALPVATEARRDEALHSAFPRPPPLKRAPIVKHAASSGEKDATAQSVENITFTAYSKFRFFMYHQRSMSNCAHTSKFPSQNQIIESCILQRTTHQRISLSPVTLRIMVTTQRKTKPVQKVSEAYIGRIASWLPR